MLCMTARSASRVLLVPEARFPATGPEAARIRRYRMARVRLVERRDAEGTRHPQLGRMYD